MKKVDQKTVAYTLADSSMGSGLFHLAICQDELKHLPH